MLTCSRFYLLPLRKRTTVATRGSIVRFCAGHGSFMSGNPCRVTRSIRFLMVSGNSVHKATQPRLSCTFDSLCTFLDTKVCFWLGHCCFILGSLRRLVQHGRIPKAPHVFQAIGTWYTHLRYTRVASCTESAVLRALQSQFQQATTNVSTHVPPQAKSYAPTRYIV
jgi:hypothetical protein